MENAIYYTLMALSGIFWVITYIDGIRIGFRQKTYAIPFFALGLNLAWEALYSYQALFIDHAINVQLFSKVCWLILDIPVLVTFLKFGKSECKTDLERRWFAPWTAIVLVTSFTLQIMFCVFFGSSKGNIYSSFLQNLIMSVLFISLLRQRQSSKGQSMLIAVCKCIGTLTPTVAIGIMYDYFFVTVVGLLCFMFDVLYIYFLYEVKASEKKTAQNVQETEKC